LWQLSRDRINPDVICVSETFFSSDLLMSQFNLVGFNAYHFFRPSGRRGGGVSIYLKESIRVDHNVSKRSCNDIQFLTLRLLDFDLYLCGVYRPPTYPFSVENDFLELFDDILNLRNLIILGDFNIDLLRDSPFRNNYQNLLTANDFYTLNKINGSYATRTTSILSS